MRKTLPIYFVKRQVWGETKYLHKISRHFYDKTHKIPYSITYSMAEKKIQGTSRTFNDIWTRGRGRVDTLVYQSGFRTNYSRYMLASVDSNDFKRL